MRAVFRGYVLAMETTLGSIGLVDVEHLEMVAKEEPADAGGRSRSRVFQILPRTVAESNNGALPGGLGLATHAMLEGGDELGLALLLQPVGLEAVSTMDHPFVVGPQRGARGDEHFQEADEAGNVCCFSGMSP